MIDKVQIYVVTFNMRGVRIPVYFDRSPSHSEVIEAVRELLHPTIVEEVLA
jgi:hypothetical protein